MEQTRAEKANLRRDSEAFKAEVTTVRKHDIETLRRKMAEVNNSRSGDNQGNDELSALKAALETVKAENQVYASLLAERQKDQDRAAEAEKRMKQAQTHALDFYHQHYLPLTVTNNDLAGLVEDLSARLSLVESDGHLLAGYLKFTLDNHVMDRSLIAEVLHNTQYYPLPSTPSNNGSPILSPVADVPFTTE
ncbi:hypothetical protein BT63DRAFT_477934 [Microthyrium microscopicum]|uniref:Uncharacterized protein n=1 Tax=Microthyrium microscopicum TaxID=703497 RepID=A0A6A6UJ14_9PEZI|nr:hypothetical protein BT63DRAFT_477934 [Microthyrium microscopicum]